MKFPLFYPINEKIQQKSREIQNFIVTNVNHYCGAPRCQIKLLNAYPLLLWAYILISGIKCKKKKFQNFSTKFPAKKKFIYPPIQILASEKKNFFFILFLISKCTHQTIKMTCLKSWYHFWLSLNNGLFL